MHPVILNITHNKHINRFRSLSQNRMKHCVTRLELSGFSSAETGIAHAHRFHVPTSLGTESLLRGATVAKSSSTRPTMVDLHLLIKLHLTTVTILQTNKVPSHSLG